MSGAPKTITSFGLGGMGAAMAQNLLEAGMKVTVWNRTPDRASVKELVSAGAKFEANPQAAMKASELIVFCLLDYASVYEVLGKIDEGELKGKIFLQLTTANSEEGPKMQAWSKERGVKAYFDGAIMHVPQHVGSDHAFHYVAGETKEAFSVIEPSLKTLGSWEYLGGDTSSSALHDGALLAGMYGMFGGCLTAIALLSKAKPPRKTAEVVKTQLMPALASLAEWVTEASEKFDEKDWGGYTATNEVNAYALGNITKSCEVEGIDTSALKGIQDLFARAVKEGKGSGGMAYCVNYLLEGKK